MSNPTSVRGIRRILDGIVDHVVEVSRNTNRAEGRYDVSALLKMDGEFSFDRDGELAFSGQVSGVPAPQIAGAEVSGGYSRSTNSVGGGRMTLEVTIRVWSPE